MASLSCKDIILWKDIRISAAIFGLLLFLLTALSFYSVLTVITCLAIPLITVLLLLRAAWILKCAFFKQPLENPFQSWLDKDVNLDEAKISSCNKQLLLTVDIAIKLTKHIVLVNDLLETTKVLAILFFLYYLSNNFSGITLLFASTIILFSVPKIFHLYKDDIYRCTDGIQKRYNELYERIKSTITSGRSGKDKSS